MSADPSGLPTRPFGRAWGVSPMMKRRIMGLTPHARQSATATFVCNDRLRRMQRGDASEDTLSVGRAATYPERDTSCTPSLRVTMNSYVTHLESALDGKRFPAGQVHTTHQGRPLWVRYDLDAVR